MTCMWPVSGASAGRILYKLFLSTVKPGSQYDVRQCKAYCIIVYRTNVALISLLGCTASYAR